MDDDAEPILKGAASLTTSPLTREPASQLRPATPHQLFGRARVRRIGRWSFPVYELTDDSGRVAAMGRTGWLKVYIWRGQRIELADGEHWTLRSIGSGGAISPIIVDSAGRKVTIAGMAHGTYGINGRDYAYSLYPASTQRFGRAHRWILRQFEDELAIVTRRPLAVNAMRPVHLGAVLLSFHVVRYGLPEEASPVLAPYTWGAR